MRHFVIILNVLVIGALLIVANGNLHINDSSDRQVLFDYVYNWFDKLYQRSAGFVGYVVKSEWLPETPSTPEEETEENK